uniref:hypothetical protein n=1 Tax=Paractinoplanes polyasparticus TaxID=2856853 RepID=UPI001C858015|nr:hypothetical protein [Actinoplanes polyasparticus]
MRWLEDAGAAVLAWPVVPALVVVAVGGVVVAGVRSRLVARKRRRVLRACEDAAAPLVSIPGQRGGEPVAETREPG